MPNSIGEYGALVKVRLSNPRPRPFVFGDGVAAFPGSVEVDALVSTGAAVTSVLPELIHFPLGLPRAWHVPLRRAADTGRVTTTYVVDLEVGGVRLEGLEVTDGAGGRDFAQARGRVEGETGESLPPFHVILGRDVLRRARLVYEGSRGAFDLVFA